MTKSTCQPPCTITPEILNRVAAISVKFGPAIEFPPFVTGQPQHYRQGRATGAGNLEIQRGEKKNRDL